jgi:hypothetical protein
MERKMRKSKFAGWALAAALAVAALSTVAQEEGPILLPKPKPVVKPAAPSATLLVICDLACNWKLDGKSRGRIGAGDSATVPVSLGQHLVAAATVDGLDKLENEIEIKIVGQTITHIALQPMREARLKADQDAKDKAAREARDKAALAEKAWTDPATGLIWTKTDNGSDVTWQQATDYCRNLRLADHGDWRLPTIDELQGIYDPSVLVDHWHVKGGLQLSGNKHWSSSQGDASGEAWFYYLSTGARFTLRFGVNYSLRALCVRRSGQDSAASARTQSQDAAGVWTDPATGLTWAKKDNGDNLLWQQAADYCRNLQLAGHTDWRLPTIDELQSIYDPNAGRDHVKGNLQLSAWWEWSSSQGKTSGEEWDFTFNDGNRVSTRRDAVVNGRALCVRRSRE